MAVLGSGGSYTVGGCTSQPQEARGPCTQARLQPRRPARGPVRGSPERRVKAAWLEGRERGMGAAGSPERRAPRAASSEPLTDLAGTGERQSINKPRRERARETLGVREGRRPSRAWASGARTGASSFCQKLKWPPCSAGGVEAARGGLGDSGDFTSALFRERPR